MVTSELQFSIDIVSATIISIPASKLMATKGKSRWADDNEDAAFEMERIREKEEKKRVKAEKHRKLAEAEMTRQQGSTSRGSTNGHVSGSNTMNERVERPSKRRRLSPEYDHKTKELPAAKLLRFPASGWGPCRHVDNFEKLNHIEEGSYGWVSRAREIAMGEIVALKKLKMDNSNDGFPVTGLREIQTLMESRHENVVNLREVVMGDKMDEYVFTNTLEVLLDS